ncbi:MBL fold metallo-hydrolase [Desulfosporosinus sp. PR]|uniref:MBL fold metallo-hydrolase n=1 Tax=Candidatus Desulfosporosinus nitrosoreducens TaxID=3401928 RepID=UPI0027EA845B|nr:MBL fold metallo-hydrolase [Desulfosporosinus sp. PR]MDQ7094584.1 MBL fold metallo-hydrolase [Desulfosporosinus sp. PR]
MNHLIVLGTGCAAVTKCYNTCFALSSEDHEYLLVDAGGGNGILAALEKAGISLARIHHVFVSHKHSDHLLGMVWIIRMVASSILSGQYSGNLKIYCHEELTDTIITLAGLTLDQKLTDLIGSRILLIPLYDGQTSNLLGRDFTFFDIHSSKAKQFGFTVKLSNEKLLTFLGDEPCNELCRKYALNSDWLLSEAFCLYCDREKFKPYEKDHSTVKDACELAASLNIKNLVLWHTEDTNITRRKELYTAEGRKYYSGNLFVPDDLDTITL